MNLRSAFRPSMLPALVCALLAAAPVSSASTSSAPCQAAPDQLVSVELAWTPREALRQQRLMAKTLDAIKPGAPGKRDVFILSAALGGEHVFDQEAASGADILARHYVSSRKTVLSNGAAALGRDRAAATPENVSAALAKIGEAMNAEDVLVLFITSHGTQDKGAAIYEAKRLQAFLAPARLKAELDDASIKNRVLIISACFAGLYIPYLKNDDTAIFTAASAERSSFGCQPERDWTYFGDALFAHALTGGASLIDGFEQAKILIQKWEGELGVTPSEPRTQVGPNAKVFLEELDKRRPAKIAAAPN